MAFLFGKTSTIVLPSSMKELPFDLKGSAVISISNQGESCKPAVQSILRNHRFFGDVHIVYKGTTGENHRYYKGWEEDLKKLQDLGLEPHRHAVLNLQTLGTLLRVDIPPDMKVQEGALFQLWDSIIYPSISESGVSSQLSIVPYENTTWRETFEAWTCYGFLFNLLFLDSLRYLFSGFQYTRTCDLRAVRLSRVYPSLVREPPNRWYMWWVGTGITQTKRGDIACIQEPRDQGLAFLLRTIKTHRYLTWIGTWWLLLAVYYFLFAIPWWNPFFDPKGAIGQYIVRDVWHFGWIFWYLIHILMVGIVAWINVEDYPPYMLGPQVLFTSAYLTVFPLVLLVCKINPLKHIHAETKQKQFKRE